MKIIELNFMLEALEDFHIGNGLNKVGYYDEGQVKDDKGLPLIRSETFKGLFKQSCYEIAYIESNLSDNHNYDKILSSVFEYGYTNSLDIYLNLQETEKENYYIIHYFTEINDSTGIAKEKSLRAIEFATKGLIFDGSLSFIVLEDAYYEDIKLLFIAALKNIKKIGSNRRRGFGLVHIKQIEEIVINEKDVEQLDATSLNNMNEIALVLELQDNTTISGSGQKGNLLESLDYFNGYTILGMLRAVMKLKNEYLDFLDDGQVSASYFYPLPDSANFTDNTYPLIMPVPQTLRKKKDVSSPKEQKLPHWVYKDNTQNSLVSIVSKDLFSSSINPNRGNTKNVTQDKSFSEGYIYIKDINNTPDAVVNNSVYYKVRKNLIMRNQINPGTQTTGENGIIVEEQVAKGTQYLGKLTFKDNNKLQQFCDFFKLWLRSGLALHGGRGSKPSGLALHGGRGSKPIKIISFFFPDKKEHDLRNFNNDYYTITCLTDVILRDGKGEYRPTITEEDLKELFGNPSLRLVSFLHSNNVIQSFSGTSGLKRFSERAITKGSCYLFTCTEDILGKSKEIERNGIGYKRNEGFGRILINNPIHTYNFSGQGKMAENNGLAIKSNNKENLLAERVHRKFYDAEELKSRFYKENLNNTPSSSFLNNILSMLKANITEDAFCEYLKHCSQKRETDAFKALQKIVKEELNTTGFQELKPILIVTLYLLKIELKQAKGEPKHEQSL